MLETATNEPARCSARMTRAQARMQSSGPRVFTRSTRSNSSGSISVSNQVAAPQGWNSFAFIANLTGQPAASLPAGLDQSGMPVGIQLIGPHLGDEVLLRACAAFEAAAPFPCLPESPLQEVSP